MKPLRSIMRMIPLVLVLLVLASCQAVGVKTLNRPNWGRAEVMLSSNDLSDGQVQGMRPSRKPISVRQAALGLSTWGVGPDGRVYRWNGSSWDEPNPAARLKQVSVGKNGGVWGIGPDGRVYRWNGNSWDEPAPGAGLEQISNMNGTEVWGIGANYRSFRSSNGGASWDPVAVQLKQVSAGKDWNNIWGVTADSHVLKFNPNKNGWDEPNVNAGLNQIDAWTIEGAWGIGANLRVFKTYDGTAWDEPNPNAGLHQVSGIDDLNAWGVGANNRVFRTTNGGASWNEPNPVARLKQVSMGYE